MKQNKSKCYQSKDLVQKRMAKRIFPKSHIFWKMCPDPIQHIRKSWDLHCVFIVQVAMRFGKKNFLKMTSICKGIS